MARCLLLQSREPMENNPADDSLPQTKKKKKPVPNPWGMIWNFSCPGSFLLMVWPSPPCKLCTRPSTCGPSCGRLHTYTGGRRLVAGSHWLIVIFNKMARLATFDRTWKSPQQLKTMPLLALWGWITWPKTNTSEECALLLVVARLLPWLANDAKSSILDRLAYIPLLAGGRPSKYLDSRLLAVNLGRTWRLAWALGS